MPADLDALDALLQAATPGPWWTGDRSEVDDAGCVMASGWDRMASDAVVADCNDHDPRRIANAALIAAAVTALPDLLREVRIGRAAREVADALDARREWSNRDPDASELWEHRQEAERLDVALDAARARYRALLETPDA